MLKPLRHTINPLLYTIHAAALPRELYVGHIYNFIDTQTEATSLSPHLWLNRIQPSPMAHAFNYVFIAFESTESSSSPYPISQSLYPLRSDTYDLSPFIGHKHNQCALDTFIFLKHGPQIDHSNIISSIVLLSVDDFISSTYCIYCSVNLISHRDIPRKNI